MAGGWEAVEDTSPKGPADNLQQQPEELAKFSGVPVESYCNAPTRTLCMSSAVQNVRTCPKHEHKMAGRCSETSRCVFEHIPYGAVENNHEKGCSEAVQSSLRSCIVVLFMVYNYVASQKQKTRGNHPYIYRLLKGTVRPAAMGNY